MFHQMNRPSLQFQLKILCVLVLHLLLTHSCRGQSQLIGSSQPIVATVGGDIILPCQLQPVEDVSTLTVEWTRSDLNSINVHVRRAGQDLTYIKHPSYQGRTSLFIDGLKQGNISLKLSKVKLSDGGKYRCYIPKLNKESFIELIVVSETVSSPDISVAGLDRVRGGVVLQCESKGWHPQPEVFWLDGEGNLLSAEPTETVRGPDGLYTVNSRLTVEKRLSNSFTCRVQQNNINQTRETNIIVPDDFFKVPCSSSPVIIGLAVSLVVCVVVVVAVFFFVWKWKQNMIKTKSCWDETEGGGNKKLSKSGDPEMHPLNAEETHGGTLTVNPAVSEENKQKREKAEEEVKTLTEKLKKKDQEWEGKETAADRLLQEEKQYREKEVKDLKNQLESKQKQIETLQESVKHLKVQNKEIKNKQAECDLLMKLLQLHEENQRTMRDLQTLKENLETKTKELKTIKPGWFGFSDKEEQQRKEQTEKEKEVETLKKELQTKQEEFETKTKEIEALKAELQQLRGNQKKETDLQRQTEETNNEETQGASKHNNTIPACKVLVEIDSNGKYLRLTNESKEDLQLEGWKLRVKLNNQSPITYTFEESIILKAEKRVTIWASGFGIHHSPSDLQWEELKRWTKGDKLLVELIDCDEEIVTTTERESPVNVEVDPNGKYIRLTTESKEDLKLEGWRLRVKVNDQNPIMYRFEKSIKLKAEKNVYIWVPGCVTHSLSSSDPTWVDLQRWTKEDKLLVELINCDGEIVKTTKV